MLLILFIYDSIIYKYSIIQTHAYLDYSAHSHKPGWLRCDWKDYLWSRNEVTCVTKHYSCFKDMEPLSITPPPLPLKYEADPWQVHLFICSSVHLFVCSSDIYNLLHEEGNLRGKSLAQEHNTKTKQGFRPWLLNLWSNHIFQIIAPYLG